MNENHAAKALTDSFEPISRIVSDDAGLKLIADLDNEFYGSHSVDYAGLHEWSRRYPDGVHGLLFPEEAVGAIGIWPIFKATFDRLKDGKLDEAAISKNDIDSNTKIRRFWYLGGITMRRDYIRHYIFPFVETALRAWLKNGKLAPSLDLCAIVASPKDAICVYNLLGKLQMKEVAKTPSGLPVFAGSITREELKKIVDKQFNKSKLPKRDRVPEQNENVSLLNKVRNYLSKHPAVLLYSLISFFFVVLPGLLSTYQSLFMDGRTIDKALKAIGLPGLLPIQIWTFCAAFTLFAIFLTIRVIKKKKKSGRKQRF